MTIYIHTSIHTYIYTYTSTYSIILYYHWTFPNRMPVTIISISTYLHTYLHCVVIIIPYFLMLCSTPYSIDKTTIWIQKERLNRRGNRNRTRVGRKKDCQKQFNFHYVLLLVSSSIVIQILTLISIICIYAIQSGR